MSEYTDKIIGAIAGFFGGVSLAFFWRPKALMGYGMLVAGAIIGAISVAASFVFSGIIVKSLGFEDDVDMILAIGYFVGMIATVMIMWIANFIKAREDKDIMQIAKEIKEQRKND
jgi:drug/metabolite transporter (DMT)-like permease